MSFDPSRTQRVFVEIERIGNTDKHQTFELLMHVIENIEAGVKDNASDIDTAERRLDARLNAVAGAQLSEKQVKDLIAGAFMLDAKNRDEAAKKRYFARIFWKAIAPLSAALGTALSTLIAHLITHWHMVPR